MSAYIVNRDHILYMVRAAIARDLGGHMGAFYWAGNHKLEIGDYEGAAQVANMLWKENIKSVSTRYGGEKVKDLPGPCHETFIITPDEFYTEPGRFEPVQVMKACQCFEYQSCEHDGWEKSEAHEFIQALVHAAIHALPGYDAAEWGAPKADPCQGRTVWNSDGKNGPILVCTR